jgi:hypothetical protein
MFGGKNARGMLHRYPAGHQCKDRQCEPQSRTYCEHHGLRKIMAAIGLEQRSVYGFLQSLENGRAALKTKRHPTPQFVLPAFFDASQ